MEKGANWFAAVTINESAEIARNFGVGRLSHQAVNPESERKGKWPNVKKCASATMRKLTSGTARTIGRVLPLTD